MQPPKRSIGAAPMGVHADGGLEKSIFLIFKSFQKKKIGAEFGGFGPGKRFLRRFGSPQTKNHSKICLGVDFLGQKKSLTNFEN